MHNWLIFQYHRVRAHSKTELLRGCSFGSEPTHSVADSDGETQEGRSTRALVVPG
jgi:hypothetical protein